MNYLLDTNVLSEARRSRGNPQVRRWLGGRSPESIHVSVLVLGEIRRGIEQLRTRDPGRCASLEAWLDGIINSYTDRLLPIDEHVADEWGRLQALAGPLPFVDSLLAATAKIRGLTVVTRNVTDFERAGVPVLNPWLDHP